MLVHFLEGRPRGRNFGVARGLPPRGVVPGARRTLGGHIGGQGISSVDIGAKVLSVQEFLTGSDCEKTPWAVKHRHDLRISSRFSWKQSNHLGTSFLTILGQEV